MFLKHQRFDCIAKRTNQETNTVIFTVARIQGSFLNKRTPYMEAFIVKNEKECHCT